jgi:ABC-type xylose transport system substrate-binding protein
MKKLKPVTKAGRGLVGVLLPDTVSSDRYTRFDAPYLKRAFSTAGLPGSQLLVDNALGSDATQFSQAQADITLGARVLILDPLDSGVGVLAPYFKSGKWTDVANPPGTWTPDVALSEFAQQRMLHPDINAALSPTDDISGPIIGYLKSKGVKAKAFPVTGQEATVGGLRNIIAGYQCGTAYQPDYLEAQGAAAVALFLRARLTPPASLVNGHYKDPQSKASVPSVLFKPVWVTTKNMKSTVIADKYVTVAQLCAKPDAQACKAAGI